MTESKHQPEAAPTGPPSAFRILIAEDEPVSRNILGELAKEWGYDAVVAEDGDQTMLALNSDDPPRLAILDWMMPGVDGVDVCRELRSRGGAPYTYVIILTAMSETEKLVEAMDAGADDFLGKPFQPHELEVRLRAGRRVVELMEELTRAREALRELATIDTLTGIWNRHSILQILDKELARRDRGSAPGSLGVLMADLDHFKSVNDRYGHLAGDQVLTATAHRIRDLLRRQDEVGRFGGEEFLAVVTSCDRDGLAAVADRIRRAVASTAVDTTAGAISITISIGGALSDGTATPDAKSLIESADTALYDAKAAGRDCAVVRRA